MSKLDSNVQRIGRLAIRQGIGDETAVAHPAPQSAGWVSLLFTALLHAAADVQRLTWGEVARYMGHNEAARRHAVTLPESAYHGDTGEVFVPNSVPLGELLAAGHGAVMGAADRRFVDTATAKQRKADAEAMRTAYAQHREWALRMQAKWGQRRRPSVSTWGLSAEAMEREATRLTGIAPDLAATSTVDSGTYQGDSDGDYRVRYFSASEGMTDTMAEAEKAVVTERGTPAWVAELIGAEDPDPTMVQVFRRRTGDSDAEGSDAAAVPSYVVGEEALLPDTEDTYMDARWAIEKDAYLDGQALNESLIERPLETAQEHGDFAAYAKWRIDRVHRLRQYIHTVAARGRKALRGAKVGPGYVGALDQLNKAATDISKRYARSVHLIVNRPGRDVKGDKVMDWHLLYLTKDQRNELLEVIRYERTRLQLAFRNREADSE